MDVFRTRNSHWAVPMDDTLLSAARQGISVAWRRGGARSARRGLMVSALSALAVGWMVNIAGDQKLRYSHMYALSSSPLLGCWCGLLSVPTVRGC
eukprot:gene11835-biopygen7848